MMTRKDFLIGAASTAATASAIECASIDGNGLVTGRARGLLGGAFMGTLLAQQGGGSPYTNLEYIDIDGGAYLSVTCELPITSTLTVDIQCLGLGGGGLGTVISSTDVGEPRFFRCRTANRFDLNLTYESTGWSFVNTTVLSRHVYDYTPTGIFIDGIVALDAARLRGYSGFSICGKYNASNTRYGYARLYSAKVVNSTGERIVDIVPVLNNDTGEAGVLDTIGNVFYRNAFTGGTISPGPRVQ